MQTITRQEFSQDFDKVWQISQKEPLLIIDEQQSCRMVLPFALYQQLIQNFNENPFNFDLEKIQKSINSGFKSLPKFDTPEALADWLGGQKL